MEEKSSHRDFGLPENFVTLVFPIQYFNSEKVFDKRIFNFSNIRREIDFQNRDFLSVSYI